MTKLPENIAIIGVGLIGGSIALGLKAEFSSAITIWGFCRSHKRTINALKNKTIDQVIINIENLNNSINMVIMAVPVSSVHDILQRLSKNNHQLLIIDVSGTKEDVEKMAAKFHRNNFTVLGTHPMAGKEMSGFEHAQSDLFHRKPWIICPSESNALGEIEMTKILINALGAFPVIMPSDRHDRLSAWTSQLPLIFGSVFMKVLAKNPDWQDMRVIASTGLKGATRLASHDPLVKLDLLRSNKKNILPALLILQNEIKLFISLLKHEKYSTILSYFIQAKLARDRWIDRTE